MHRSIAYDACTAVSFLLSGFELRLDQSDDFTRSLQQSNGWRNYFAQRNKRAIRDHDVHLFERLRKLLRPQRAGIGFLHHGDARILAKPPIELAVANIHRINSSHATLQEATGEPTGGRAEANRARA